MQQIIYYEIDDRRKPRLRCSSCCCCAAIVSTCDRSAPTTFPSSCSRDDVSFHLQLYRRVRSFHCSILPRAREWEELEVQHKACHSESNAQKEPVDRHSVDSLQKPSNKRVERDQSRIEQVMHRSSLITQMQSRALTGHLRDPVPSALTI